MPAKTIKTFLATYRPAGGVIRVVIVKEEHGCEYFFATDPDATPREILAAFADRAAIEQDFHDVKEIWGAGQQQVGNIWTNIAVFNLNLWVHTLLECWAWNKPAKEIRDRSDSPWDDPERRPSHADRRKALRREILRNEYLSLPGWLRRSSRIRELYERLVQLAWCLLQIPFVPVTCGDRCALRVQASCVFAASVTHTAARWAETQVALLSP